MQSLAEIQQQLENAVNDAVLSGEEKAELRELASILDNEKLSFLRNRAFDIARQQILADHGQAIDILRWL